MTDPREIDRTDAVALVRALHRLMAVEVEGGAVPGPDGTVALIDRAALDEWFVGVVVRLQGGADLDLLDPRVGVDGQRIHLTTRDLARDRARRPSPAVMPPRRPTTFDLGRRTRGQ